MQLNELTARILAEDFDIVYLPIISTTTGEMRGAEALVRWPMGGGQFFPVESAIGMIEGQPVELDLIRAILHKSSLDWEALGGFDRGLTLAVNASPAAFTEELPALVQDGWPMLDLLVVEMTERLKVPFYDSIEACVAQLKGMGVRVALDDYTGTVECVGKLVGIEIDHVKLDRSIMLASDHTPTVFHQATWLAKSMRRSITAEGVENAAHLMAVAKAGIHYWQGYLATKPLPAFQLAEWVKETGGRYCLPVEMPQ